MRGPSEIYRLSYWFRIAFKLGIPVVAPLFAALYAGLARQDTAVRDSPWWLVGALLAAFSVPAAAFLAKKWDDDIAEAKTRELASLHEEAAAWEATARQYIGVCTTVNQLVLEKSAGYIKCLGEALDPSGDVDIEASLARHDNLRSNCTRIIRLLYDLLRGYADPASGQEFQVAFFRADHVNGNLKLTDCFNGRDQPPQSLRGEETNKHFARDGDSLASASWRSNKMIIIADTKEELLKASPLFTRFEHGEEDRVRSIVCYPVFDGKLDRLKFDGFVGVICAHSNRPNFFTYDIEEPLVFLLDTFANRIIFEVRRTVCEVVACHGTEKANATLDRRS